MAEALKIRKWGLRSDNNLRKLDRTPDSQVLSDDRGDNPVYAGLNPGGCRSPVKRGCNAGSCGERSIPTPERWPLRPATSLSLDLNAIRGRRREALIADPLSASGDTTRKGSVGYFGNGVYRASGFRSSMRQTRSHEKKAGIAAFRRKQGITRHFYFTL